MVTQLGVPEISSCKDPSYSADCHAFVKGQNADHRAEDFDFFPWIKVLF
jgi:hypothetical protein